MPVAALAIADLIALLVAAGFGFASLLRWARHRAADFPVVKIAAHVALQLLGIGTWAAFALTGDLLLAWLAFAVLTTGQVLGDLLMFASYRIRHAGTTKPGYRVVSADVLSFRRPAPALHALTGAVAWFGMLGICIAATAAT